MKLWKSILTCFLVAGASVAQTPEHRGMILGALGRPLMVINEFGKFEPAVRVYSDSKIEDYIPDFTSQQEIPYHALTLRKCGYFTVILYVYYKDKFFTKSETAVVKEATMSADIRTGGWEGASTHILLKSDPSVQASGLLRTLQLVKKQEIAIPRNFPYGVDSCSSTS